MSTNVACQDLAAVVGFEPTLRASKARVLPNYTKPLYPPYGGADYCELGVCNPASFNFT